MKILLVHNYYRQPGGEDVMFAAEATMLREHGHDVHQFEAYNADLEEKSTAQVAITTLWSHGYANKLREALVEIQPDIVHFHNTFMAISPAAYYACQDLSIPVVQTLHNYRLVCPAATFFRDEAICTDCSGKWLPYPGIVHSCYNDSRFQTMGVSAMLTLHRALQTWSRKVDTYITLSEFGRQLFVDGGLPAHKVVVKSNFLSHPPEFSTSDERFMLFMGRLTVEKGLRVLVEAWRNLPNIPLKIAGDGPLYDELAAYLERNQMTHVELLGHQPRAQALRLLQKATALVFPSQWYETFGLVVIEAYACGKPVIAAKLGTVLETVRDGETGLHFEATNRQDLADKAQQLWIQPGLAQRLGRQARSVFETHYTSDANYRKLVAIYQQTIANKTAHDN